MRLDSTLASVGTIDVPRGETLHVELSRNGEVIYKFERPGLVSGPNKHWSFSRTDSFPHNVKTTYTISVTDALAECTKSNNQATLTIDEKKLHPAKVNLPPKAAAPIKR